jgi:hypothetical protein
MWFALDLDRTLVNDNVEPFPGIVEILDLLRANNYPLTVVSYNLNAEQLIPLLGWQSYFRKVICDRGRTKAQIIKDISVELNLRPGDAVLIDDLEDNVKTCLLSGIHALQVNPCIGFQMNEAHALLHYFRLPVMWVAPLALEYRNSVQLACPNYFLRFYPANIALEELELYASDNTTHANILGAVRPQHDQYGNYYVLALRDVSSGIGVTTRSLSLPLGREVTLAVSRVTINDVFYQLFTVGIEELEYQLRESHYQQLVWNFDAEEPTSYEPPQEV